MEHLELSDHVHPPKDKALVVALITDIKVHGNFISPEFRGLPKVIHSPIDIVRNVHLENPCPIDGKSIPRIETFDRLKIIGIPSHKVLALVANWEGALPIFHVVATFLASPLMFLWTGLWVPGRTDKDRNDVFDHQLVRRDFGLSELRQWRQHLHMVDHWLVLSDKKVLYWLGDRRCWWQELGFLVEIHDLDKGVLSGWCLMIGKVHVVRKDIVQGRRGS